MKPKPAAAPARVPALTSRLRVLVFGDPHLSAEAPGSRDPATWDAEVSSLFSQILAIATENRVHRVACTGDWFHSKTRTPHLAVNHAIDLLRPIVEKFGPVVSAVGNHDMTGNNLDTIPSQPLGTLVSAGLVSVDPVPGIRPVAYGAEPGFLNKATLYLTHSDFGSGSINDKNVINLEDDSAVVNGHIHVPGSDFIKNPYPNTLHIGCLNRVSSAEAEFVPRVAVVTIEPGKDVRVRTISLAMTAPGKTAFVDAADGGGSTAPVSGGFATALGEDTEFVDPVTMLAAYVERESVRPDVADLAKRLLEESV